MPIISTLEEKNSYCYFLPSDLGELCSKAHPLRLTICCCWTCSKPPVPEQDCRETCGKAALVSWHHQGSCGPTVPGAQPGCGGTVLFGWSAAGGRSLPAQGSPVAVLVLCWQQWSTGGVCEVLFWDAHSLWSRVPHVPSAGFARWEKGLGFIFCN